MVEGARWKDLIGHMASGARSMTVKLLAAAAVGAGLVAAAPVIGEQAGKMLGLGQDRPTAKQASAATSASGAATQTPPAPASGPAGSIAPVRAVPATRSDAITSYAPVVQRAAPAVVNVYARSVQQGRVAVDPFWGAFRIPDRARQSQGSGVIVRDDGVVVTNNHVIEGATELVVVLGDQREFPARVVLADPRTDLAVLRIDAGTERLPSLRFADTSAALVGDQVLAIGNPFGVGQSVTGGIISALARRDVGITDYSFFIQTDASINPGNSGGALVDMNGNLVGINTAIFSRSGTSAGVGFAIPSEMVRRVVEGAVTEGRVVRAWAGVRGQNVDAEMARTLGLARPGGVLVTEVWPGTAAAQAGLRRGDVVTTMGGAAVSDEGALRYIAATKRPGEAVEFAFLRQGAPSTGTGTLAPPPGNRAGTPRLLSGRSSFDGLSVSTITPALADELGLDPFTKGVVVTAVAQDREARRAGFRPGDVVLDVNGTAIESAEQLAGLIGTGEQGRVTIEREGRRLPAVLFP
jgi:Do/DeqQ family serine protease